MNILLGVCGSISAYKAYDIARNLINNGHKVRVILTKGAEHFILPSTFSHLGVLDVYSSLDDFQVNKKIENVLHIDLKNWADMFVIAPASANTIAKLSRGTCDDLLSSVFLASESIRKILFPAMNTEMYTNTITQKNLSALNALINIFIYPPSEGKLVCGEFGKGKLPKVEDICNFIEYYQDLSNKRKILITTGATCAPIDPVRYLTNPASGKTGLELAKSYLLKGCEVTLVYGAQSQLEMGGIEMIPNFKSISVHTTKQMHDVVMKNFDNSDVYISAAAVSDIEFDISENKFKKDHTGPKSMKFKWSTDILQAVLKIKKNQRVISFAAETSNLEHNFKEKWDKKPVDLMVGNLVNSGVNQEIKGFSQDGNQYFMVKEGKIVEELSLSKKDLAKYISQFTERYQ